IMELWPDDERRRRHVAIIDRTGEERVRMAHLSIVGSHSVNGVADLHSKLLRTDVVPDFYELWPERFGSVTNGVTQRRWLLKANPALADLIDRTIGSEWLTDLEKLRGLEQYAGDASFMDSLSAAKHDNKEQLAETVAETTGVRVDPYTLFDVHVKRIHEYKRQLLNVLRIIHEYLALVDDGEEPAVPRTYLFAGKAAPGYWAAKQIIKLINSVADVVNRDAKATGFMKVAFLPDYRVSLAERIIPAADVSEQISTAGTEASGTGNMKLAMNGALTVGTLDGANIEILEEVGEENMFIFGHTAEEIGELRRKRAYDPQSYYESDPSIRRVLDSLTSDRFSPREPGLFEWVFKALMSPGDPYLHLADLPSYIEIQKRVGVEYADRDGWRRKALMNIARNGRFSSDRAVTEYAENIWDLKAVHPKQEESDGTTAQVASDPKQDAPPHSGR
ncbi:glycogen/starch/alpha-glucan phosphorylase, partial [bacterium]|nr:glycogen/starch/alpha-glucan phosphorylase [bacterium]